MPPFTGEPTLSQQRALAICPKVSSLLSIAGSGFIAFEIVHRWRKVRAHHGSRWCASRSRDTGINGSDEWNAQEGRRGGMKRRRSMARQTKQISTYHRLVLGMSVCDLLVSSAFFLTTWPLPVGSPYVYGAVGNQATCTAQGFFLQLSTGTALYNGVLSLYYFLVIRFGWSDQRMQGVEPFLHAFPWVLSIVTGLAGIKLTLYNNGLFDCWISPAPIGCKQSWKNGGHTTCTRGDNASLYQFAFHYAWIWAAIVFAFVTMVVIWVHIRRRERAMKKFRVAGGRFDQRMKHSRKVAVQSFFYVGVFIFTWIFGTLTRFVQMTKEVTYFEMLLLTSITIPGQGFLNMLVYLRPRFVRFKEKHPEAGFCSILRLYCCFGCSAEAQQKEKITVFTETVSRLSIVPGKRDTGELSNEYLPHALDPTSDLEADKKKNEFQLKCDEDEHVVHSAEN